MRFESPPETLTPIRPTIPEGKPLFRVISVQVSPPSVDLKRPLPTPPLDICHDTRYASHIAAYRMFGLFRSMARSIAPVLLSRKRTLRHVLPPSCERNTPRSSLGPGGWPNAAT